MHRNAQPVEPVHVFGLAFVAQFRSDRLVGLEHRHQPAARGEEFGELQRDKVGADDDDPTAKRHPGLGRHANSFGAHQPVSPAAKPLTQRLPCLHMRQVRAGDGRQHHLTAVGHHHRVGLQVDDVVGQNLLSQFDLHRAAANLVAQPPQERLVLGVQDRRPQQCAAGLVAAFEQRDVMSPFGGHPRRLHACRPAADHHHLLGMGRARGGELALLAGARVDRAVNRETLFHGVDAVFARNALADAVGVAGGDLGRQLGIGQHRPTHRDEVRSAVGEDLLGALRIVDAADGDDRHIDHLLDGGGGADVECVAVVGAVDHAGDQPVDHAAADMEGVDSRGHQLRCHLGGFEHRATARDAFVPGDAQCDGQRVADL